jgi:UDP-N-acetyl-2-amino-2-deoxyglucuronate dehydrogenase
VIGVGIVGAGIIAEQHAQACADLADRVRLLAVADVSPENLEACATKHAIPHAYTDHRALLERDDVGVVVVATPPCFHEDVVVDALAAGKRVLCEKPLGHTLEAADRIVDAARPHPGRLSVVHQFRWWPEVRRTVWLRDRGYLGPLLFGRFSRFARFHRPGKPPRRPWWGAWDVAGGGAVMTQLIHELDLMCHIYGPAVEVTAIADRLKEDIVSEDSCSATVRFASGAVVSAFGTMVAHRSTAGFDVIGTDASAHSPWTVHAMDTEHRDEARAAALAAFPDPAPDAQSSEHTPYLRAVADAIEAGAPLPVTPEEARACVELSAGIYASALSRAPVALPMGPGSPFYAGVTDADWAGRVACANSARAAEVVL